MCVKLLLLIWGEGLIYNYSTYNGRYFTHPAALRARPSLLRKEGLENKNLFTLFSRSKESIAERSEDRVSEFTRVWCDFPCSQLAVNSYFCGL